MKKYFIAALLAALAVTIYAAAPTHRHYSVAVESQVIDSQWTSDAWELVDSAIIVSDDSALVKFIMTGVAIMDPGDRLYIGFSAQHPDSGLPNLDTIIFNPKSERRSTRMFPFTAEFALTDSTVLSNHYNGGATDTIYWQCATGGRGYSEKVTIQDVTLEAIVTDNNDAWGANIDQ